MPTGTILLLGAFAGLTIYLGLPLAFLKQTPQSLKVFLNMLATGVLIFLLFDVLSKASDPITAAWIRYEPTKPQWARSLWMCACLSSVSDLAQSVWSISTAARSRGDGRTPLSQPWSGLWSGVFKERQEASGWWLNKGNSEVAPLLC